MRKVFYNNIMARLFLWGKGFKTAMFFGFICTKRKAAEPLTVQGINHEAIHAEQYIEVTATAVLVALVLSIVFGWAAWPFIAAITLYYVIYFVEAGISWVYNVCAHQIKGTGDAANKAYYNSMFEMEAYAHEADTAYIPSRKSFHWIRNFGKV